LCTWPWCAALFTSVRNASRYSTWKTYMRFPQFW
jgi:hypothetical protein